MKTIFIAEAGVNHNASVEMALRLVDAAGSAGASYVKFQTAVPSEVMTATAGKAPYQIDADDPSESQRTMAERIHLPLDAFSTIADYCKRQGIGFLTTPFDVPSLDRVCELGMDYIKVPSGEITNVPFLRAVAGKRQPVILSTGLATIDEVVAATKTFTDAGLDRGHISLLHCTTAYPTPIEEANVRAITTLAKSTGLPVGLSDHTLGSTASLLAVALGAPIIEKHFTLDRSLPGPDHQASMEPNELKSLIDLIKEAEVTLGTGAKTPTATEEINRSIVRRSIVARRKIDPGERFTPENITTKRPEGGIPASEWDSVLGKRAPRSFQPDEWIYL